MNNLDFVIFYTKEKLNLLNKYYYSFNDNIIKTLSDDLIKYQNLRESLLKKDKGNIRLLTRQIKDENIVKEAESYLASDDDYIVNQLEINLDQNNNSVNSDNVALDNYNKYEKVIPWMNENVLPIVKHLSDESLKLNSLLENRNQQNINSSSSTEIINLDKLNELSENISHFNKNVNDLKLHFNSIDESFSNYIKESTEQIAKANSKQKLLFEQNIALDINNITETITKSASKVIDDAKRFEKSLITKFTFFSAIILTICIIVTFVMAKEIGVTSGNKLINYWDSHYVIKK